VAVEVEVDYTSGMPDAAIQESRERVQAAVRNAGVPYPRKRLAVNLARPRCARKGPACDLSIALEDKAGTISRAQGSLIFPASFQPVAAMNP